MVSCLQAYRKSKLLHKHFRKTVWNKDRLLLMKKLLIAKFAQNPNFRAKLLATGQTLLEEDNPKDEFWALGANQQGQNQLGRLLMETRELCLAAEALLALNPDHK